LQSGTEYYNAKNNDLNKIMQILPKRLFSTLAKCFCWIFAQWILAEDESSCVSKRTMQF